ncbi:MAG: hypothetical protein IT353_05435 [Gemmatimonadaceae bacterium]|nr:hypothetical protein [Gemmatimonadaceae bacterium]
MIVLYDDARARTFEPFATTRPFGEVRAGALLGRERWNMCLGAVAGAFCSAPHLAHFAEFDAPHAASLPLPAGAWLVNTRALPIPQRLTTSGLDAVRINGTVAAVRLRDALHNAGVHDGTLSLASCLPADAVIVDVDGVWVDDLWDILRHLTSQLAQDIPILAAHLGATRAVFGGSIAGAVKIGAHDVWLESGAILEPLAVCDTSAGPILVRRGSTVQAFTRLIGPLFVGCDSTVTADRIAASSIGDMCRVHGELSTSVFVGHANKGHDGFVGHSLVGRWVNMGAGTITSNLKNTYGTVAMWSPSGVRDTGLQFAGTFFGDHVKTGIGLRLTTGCVLGAGANVMDAMPPKCVPPFSWGSRAPYAPFEREKFVDIAARMMARRQVMLDEKGRVYLDDVMTHALSTSTWPSR